MSNANYPITMQSIDQDTNLIGNFNQTVGNPNNNIPHRVHPLNQNVYNNFNHQQNIFSQTQRIMQQPNRLNQNHFIPHDLQPIPNSQIFYDDSQISEPLIIPQRKQYPEGINYYKTYNYDLYNINYQNISIESWSDIPVDESPYSHMWATPESFEPEQFSKIYLHEGENKKVVDLFWLVFFYINVFCSIGVFAYLTAKFVLLNDKINISLAKIHNSQIKDDITDMELNTKEILIAVGVSAAIGLVLNIIHIVYSTLAPSIYIKDSIWLCIIISILCILLLVLKGFYYAFGFPILTLFMALFFFCCMKKYMSFSADVLTVTIKLFWRYRIFILFISIDTFFELIFGLVFSLTIFFIEYTETSRYLYIYIGFSFLWVSSTISYVTYMTVARLISSWYFLQGTDFYPKNPVWDSFKRNCFTLFGSASLAGFLLFFIKLLEFIASSDNFCCSCTNNNNVNNYDYNYTYPEENRNDVNDDRCNEHPEKVILSLIKCIAICILKIIEACIPYINQYALIYCAIFEVPFKEGCRRSAEMSCHKFCNLLLSGCRIKSAMFFNGLILTVGSVSIALGLSNYLFKLNTSDKVMTFSKISLAIFAFIFTYSIFQVFTQPFLTIADSLIICFSEAPEKLKISENELYVSMKSFYEKSVNEMIQSTLQ